MALILLVAIYEYVFVPWLLKTLREIKKQQKEDNK